VLRCASRVVFGDVYQELKPAGQSGAADSGGLQVFIFIEGPDRDETLRRCMTENCVDEVFDLLAVGLKHGRA
jgi:hypothetical protein